MRRADEEHVLPAADLREEVLVAVVVRGRRARAVAGPQLAELQLAGAGERGVEQVPVDVARHVAEQRGPEVRDPAALGPPAVGRVLVEDDHGRLEVEPEVRPRLDGVDEAGDARAGDAPGAEARAVDARERAAARRVVDRERRRGARGPPQVVEGPAVDEAFREAPAAAGQDDGLAAAHRVGDGGDVVAADPRDLARAHPRGVGRPLVSAGQYLCRFQPLVWVVLTKLQNSLARSNRSRFG